MEYGLNFAIFGLKMMVKGSVEKIFFKFLHAQRNFGPTDLLWTMEAFLQNYKNDVDWELRLKGFKKQILWGMQIWY